MVDVSYENHSGIIQVRATAFTPEDARTITRAILEKSTTLVNHLAEQARTDAIRFAKVDLDEAEAHLRDLRQELASFRREHQMVDPQADVEGQMGLLDRAAGASSPRRWSSATCCSPMPSRPTSGCSRRTGGSPPSPTASRTSAPPSAPPAPRGRCPRWWATSRRSRSTSSSPPRPIPRRSPTWTLARAEARRQSRYLAAHVEPTLAESSLYPRRALLSGLVGLFLLLGWGVLMLVYYNVRDSR